MEFEGWLSYRLTPKIFKSYKIKINVKLDNKTIVRQQQ